MNATQQQQWWLIFHKFQQSREQAWQGKIYSALQKQIKKVTYVIKTSGIDAAKSELHSLINSEDLTAIIKNIYIDAGTVFGGKAYQLVKKQGQQKEQKGMMPIGYNEALINEITAYFQLSIYNQAVLRISETTRDFLYNVMVRSQQEGVSIDDIVKELETTDITTNRARMIARTETVKAANYGAVAAIKKTGYITNKIWISGQDIRTRRLPRDEADHLHANGQTVPTDQPFKIRDKKMGGYVDMMQPGDPNGGVENVVNCRCTIGFKVITDSRGVPLSGQQGNIPPVTQVLKSWPVKPEPVKQEFKPAPMIKEAESDHREPLPTQGNDIVFEPKKDDKALHESIIKKFWNEGTSKRNGEEISDEFHRIVSEEKKHREVINTIKGLMTALKPVDNTNKISELITSNTNAAEAFVNKLKEISAVKIPPTQITVNNDELIIIARDIKQLFAEIKSILSEKKEWEFKVNRDVNGRIIGVTAIQTNLHNKK